MSTLRRVIALTVACVPLVASLALAGQPTGTPTSAPLRLAIPRKGSGDLSLDIATLNRNFASLCSFKALTVELDQENARRALKTLKKGDKLGRLSFSSDGKTYPFTYTLRDATLTTVLQRKNGTARLALDYAACEQIPR